MQEPVRTRDDYKAQELQTIILGVLGVIFIIVAGCYMITDSENRLLEKCIETTQKVLECKS